MPSFQVSVLDFPLRSAVQLLERANQVLQQAGVDDSWHEGVAPNTRGTAVFLTFKEAGRLRIAANKVRRLNQSFNGSRVWLDARRTRAENRPAKAIHRAVEALSDLNTSIVRDGGTALYNSGNFNKNMRRMCVEDGADGPALCWWNVRQQELSLAPACVAAYSNVHREADLEQISAWCSLE